MKKRFNNLIFIILLLTLLNACQSLKDGLQGNKKSKSAEEFLIEKKNPLVMPPDFAKMPKPISEEGQNQEKIFEIEDILRKKDNTIKPNIPTKDSTNLKSSIIKKIKNN